MKRKTAIQEIMDEKVVYGGLIATRGEVTIDLQSVHKDGHSIHWLLIDKLVFGCPLATPWDLEHRMTLKQARAKEK